MQRTAKTLTTFSMRRQWSILMFEIASQRAAKPRTKMVSWALTPLRICTMLNARDRRIPAVTIQKRTAIMYDKIHPHFLPVRQKVLHT